MKLRTYPVLERAVEEGVAYAITRLFKHNDIPLDEQALRLKQDEITMHIMGVLDEVINFDE